MLSMEALCLPGKLKLGCLQFGVLPQLLLPLTVYDVAFFKVEKLERMFSMYIRKWLGASHCLSSLTR